jgi:hypothetical protein
MNSQTHIPHSCYIIIPPHWDGTQVAPDLLLCEMQVFENVCELDLIFHTDKVHHILVNRCTEKGEYTERRGDERAGH